MLILLTLFDVLCALTIGLSFILPRSIVLTAAMYLIFKGGFFGMTGNFMSWIDLACGIYMIFLAYGLSSVVITIIAFLYLIQKGIIAFLR